MSEGPSLFDQILEKVGYILNKDSPMDELNKLVVMEYSLNPIFTRLGYDEVFDIVMQKFIKAYHDEELMELWNAYKFYESLSKAA